MKRLIYILPLFAALAMTSCYDKCKDCDFPDVYNRVMFHYMAMDNDLSAAGAKNIQDMVIGATKQNLNGGVIFVFDDRPNNPSRLLRIEKGKIEEVKVYDENLDATDPLTFKTAFNDVRSMVAAKSWVLSAGSHGLGWMPARLQGGSRSTLRSMDAQNSYNPLIMDRDPYRNVETRAFINDQHSGSRWMEIGDFAAALPDDIVFEAIIMDICFMGSIEFAYLLKDHAKNLVLSPAEVISYGMPYDRVIDDIFAEEIRLGEGGVCEEFYTYYSTDTEVINDYNRFGTIAHIKCSELDNFANVMTQILTPKKDYMAGMSRSELDENVLYLDRHYGTHWAFDLATLIHHLYKDDSATLKTFDDAIGSLIPYKKTTGWPLYSLVVPEDKFCGISTYVPLVSFSTFYKNMSEAYWETAWAKKVYSLE